MCVSSGWICCCLHYNYTTIGIRSVKRDSRARSRRNSLLSFWLWFSNSMLQKFAEVATQEAEWMMGKPQEVAAPGCWSAVEWYCIPQDCDTGSSKGYWRDATSDACKLQLEMLAEISKGSDDEKASFLTISLRGPALTVLILTFRSSNVATARAVPPFLTVHLWLW